MTTAPPTKAFGAPFEPLSIDETALAREYAPSAFGGFYADEMRPKPYAMHGDVAVVTIEGPLDTRAGWWCDGYDEITERAAMALSDPKVRALVLALDSPGGMAAGNLDAARTLRSLVESSGKPCVAHAGTMACSAAYALACAADAIHLTADGVVGSIGTIATVYDRAEANELRGLNVKVVRSGTLKADPHPDVPLTDASVARVRARINELAGMFSAWVAERRPAMGDPLTLQGASVYGADAVAKGVADQVGTLADAINTAAQLAADSATKRKPTPGMPGMAASGTLGVRSMADAAITDDRGFIDAMIPHHEAALAMVEKADGKLKNADLKKLAAGIKAAQTAEIAEMERIRGALPPKKTAAALAADSAARTKEKTMDTNAAKSLETLASIRTALDVKSDEEAIATVATLHQRARQVDTLAADVATLRQQLADRDAATVTAARQAVLDRHVQRGGLTPAMQADAQYMGDLAPLAPDALDRVLSKLPSAPAAVVPRTSGIDPKGTDPESLELTDEDRAFAKAAGLSEEAFLATKRADAKRAARIGR